MMLLMMTMGGRAPRAARNIPERETSFRAGQAQTLSRRCRGWSPDFDLEELRTTWKEQNDQLLLCTASGYYGHTIYDCIITLREDPVKVMY